MPESNECESAVECECEKRMPARKCSLIWSYSLSFLLYQRFPVSFLFVFFFLFTRFVAVRWWLVCMVYLVSVAASVHNVSPSWRIVCLLFVYASQLDLGGKREEMGAKGNKKERKEKFLCLCLMLVCLFMYTPRISVAYRVTLII